ncbi:ATP-dependent DNA helicase, Rep family [Bowdeniella nasicola]|uniref:DNA 3'-5' helicase n=1 Tax=Bowdeniella nasicola TaxID=208480 RepID=A0A1H3VTJ4_9ACTO|nr:ATP-dependent DNA helicase UvrD2 [Bowdeniella nasicola]SDZ78096.1 ATP-dependent DNA helicase, Rep family [Bowdeniella nasicola]
MSLLDALDPDQRQVAEHLRGPLCVLAGAGTGKTRAITYRIAHGVRTGVYQPTSVLAVTFTARAAGEMRSRLRELGVVGVQARTFHAAALRQLGYFWPKVVGGPLPKVEEKTLGLVAEAAGRLGIETDRALLFDLNAEIKWAKVQMIAPDDYPQRATAAGRAGIADVDPTTIASLMNAYEDAKSERGVIDFEDILLILVGLLVEKPEIAEEVRRQYRYFVVDEYQDVSPLQQRLLELWLGERDDLCVVGDVSQTIYSFAGASPGFLTGFSRTFPGAAKIQLVRDYRSTPQVVDIANRLLRTKTGRLPEGAVYLQAQRPSSVPVHFTGYDDDAAEAEAIARAITELNDTGVALSEIAILYRTNAQSQAFETALATAGIGYQIRGGERFFARADIRRALVMLRGAMNTSEEADMPRAVRAILSNLGWSNAAPEQAGAMRERWDALNALVVLADDMHATRGASLADFVEELHDRAANQHAPAVEGVTLASIHSSKGLEWDAVFLAGLSEGLMPISMANTPEAIEEEKRLLYVGVTRAREHLRLSYSSSRTGGRSSRNVSRFLTGIWPEAEKSTSKTSRRKKAAIDPLAELDDDAQALFELLRAWRAETAKEISKPAFTILHDATLIAIAQAQPRTLRQLALLRGIGATKLDRYGGEILALIADN